ncbi:hypothetical protein ABIF50_010353 [Bradyrhizobium diazoefficiens]
MVKGLVSAAKLKRQVTDKPALPAFDQILHALGEQPYFSIQPLVCNIRNIPLGGTGAGGIRGVRLETISGETAAFKVYLSERHTLWVVDGQHRRKGADLAMEFLEAVRSTEVCRLVSCQGGRSIRRRNGGLERGVRRSQIVGGGRDLVGFEPGAHLGRRDEDRLGILDRCHGRAPGRKARPDQHRHHELRNAGFDRSGAAACHRLRRRGSFVLRSALEASEGPSDGADAKSGGSGSVWIAASHTGCRKYLCGSGRRSCGLRCIALCLGSSST